MKKMIVVGIVVLVAAWGCRWSAKHYVLKTDNGLVVLSKRYMTFADSFRDVRSWSCADFDAHPEMKRALVEQGYRDMLIALRERELEMEAKSLARRVTQTATELKESVRSTMTNWLNSFDGPATNSLPDAASPKVQ